MLNNYSVTWYGHRPAREMASSLETAKQLDIIQLQHDWGFFSWKHFILYNQVKKGYANLKSYLKRFPVIKRHIYALRLIGNEEGLKRNQSWFIRDDVEVQAGIFRLEEPEGALEENHFRTDCACTNHNLADMDGFGGFEYWFGVDNCDIDFLLWKEKVFH